MGNIGEPQVVKQVERPVPAVPFILPKKETISVPEPELVPVRK